MTTNDKNTATAIHLSSLTQYFIPLGNFIFPVILWSSLKTKSNYINDQGKETINFQLSIFLYTMIMALITVPVLLVTVFKNFNFNNISNNTDFYFENFSNSNISGILIFAILSGVVYCSLKVFEFVLIIYAAVKTSTGVAFKYPLTIPFIK